METRVQTEPKEYIIAVDENGCLQFIYDDALAFLLRGSDRTASVKRASHVEPNEQGKWTADMSPVGGPVLGPFDFRQEALTAETDWLMENYIGQ